jgi:hypothetical protein
MPTYARGQIVVEDMVGVYHCIARCVRRAFLCGVDPYTGQDYSHRKEWILDRLRDLAGLFAIEVCGYSVMSNHLHLVLRNRPDLAEQWSADEIALRWCRVFPPRDDATGEPVEPGEHDLAMLMANSDRLAEVRKRLANLSWFMRCLCEKIARAANHAAGLDGAGTPRGQARRDSGSPGPDRGAAGAQSIELGGNRARLRSTIQAGGGPLELTRRCRGTPLAALVPGQGGRSSRLCVGHWIDRHRALNRHLHDAFTRKALRACARTSLLGAVLTGQYRTNRSTSHVK